MNTVKIIALLCRLTNPHDCHEETIKSVLVGPTVSMISCAVGQPALAEFMAERPAYRLELWRCEAADKGDPV